MKQKLKHYFQCFAFLFFILMLYQCQKVDDLQTPTIEPKTELNITIVHGDEHFAKSHTKIYNTLKEAGRTNVLSRATEYSEDYDFYFILDNIQIIEKSSYTQYTVVVESENAGNVLLNYVLLDYPDGVMLQYLVTYPRNAEGIDYDHATIQSLNGQSIMGRSTGLINCADGAPELVDVTQQYICTETKCGTNNHGVGDDCLCGTYYNGVYQDCSRAFETCDWQSVNVWSCTGGSDGGNPDSSENPGGSSAGGNDPDPDPDPADEEEPLETVALEILEPESSETCNKIMAQIEDEDYIAAKEYLDNKIGEPIEYGKSLTTNGLYEDIEQNANNGDQLKVEIDSNMLGFIHTHLNDVVQVLDDGAIKTTYKIRMFSPKDLKSFLLLVKNAHDNNLNTADVFVTMLSSSGDYTLRFDGNINDMVNNITPELLDYLESQQSVNDYLEILYESSTESVLLHFMNLKIPSISGVNLFKITNRGVVQRKYLNENNRVRTNRCE